LGLIQDDQTWTGVSKLAITGGTPAQRNDILYLAELRRGAAGRNETFAVRRLQENGVDLEVRGPVALTHNGARLAFQVVDGNDRKLRLYDSETATFSNINFTAGAQQPDTLGMEYTPFGGLLFATVGFPPAGDCIKQVRLLTAANGPAGALLAESTFRTC